MSPLALLLIVGCCLCAGHCETLNISAFNIKIFGRTKFSRTEVVQTLRQIVLQYDVVLIQEIRDSSEEVIFMFQELVNNNSDTSYDLVVSERLGRTNSKEQYAFLYRSDKLRLVGQHQYNDTIDVFERPPFTVLFESLELDIPQFFLMGIHVQPSNVFAEMQALPAVYDEVSALFSAQGVIMGDMNADCSFLSNSAYSMLDLVTEERFVILFDLDTTVAVSECSYDRIIVHSNLTDVVADSGVDRFDLTFDLTMEEADSVSDHYPVFFVLQGDPLGTDATTSSGEKIVGHIWMILCAVLFLLCGFN